MNTGVYGTRIGANVTSADIDVFYSYRENRNTDGEDNNVFKRLPSDIITQATATKDGEMTDGVLEGLYNIKLPLQYFNKSGIYTVYIKPKEIKLSISDVSVLAAYEDVRGIVFDTTKIDDNNVRNLILQNNSLVGYRVCYFDEYARRQSYNRVITSNNKCEPMMASVANSTDKTVKYRYNDSSTLVFCTMTPSASVSFKANSSPYIGVTGQNIALVNTKFEPVMLEIEMTEHDIETVSTMLEGTQLRSLDNGLVTTYNSNGEIYAQHEHYTLKDEYTGSPIYEVKKNKKDNIDFSQTMEGKE